MGTKEFIEIAGVFGLSAIKFGVAGVPAAVFAKLSFFKALTVTVTGGYAGVLFFTYLSDRLIRFFHKVNNRFFKKENQVPKKKFTKTNRLIIIVKQKFGLAGLAIVTPLILSIPLGIFLAVRYYHNKQKIVSYMFVSIFAWAILLYFFYHFIYHRILLEI